MVQPPRGGGDCERGDVAVPGEVVWFLARGCDGFVGGDGGGVGGGFEFAQDYATLDTWTMRKRGREGEVLYPSISPSRPSITWHSSGHFVRYSR